MAIMTMMVPVFHRKEKENSKKQCNNGVMHPHFENSQGLDDLISYWHSKICGENSGGKIRGMVEPLYRERLKKLGTVKNRRLVRQVLSRIKKAIWGS